MKKIEDIPRKEIFTTPEGYFDKLPGIIQARVAAREKSYSPIFIFSLRYALPAMLLFALSIFWYSNTHQTETTETILATVPTEDLMAYLDNSELTSEEVLESIDFNTTDVDDIEGQVYHLDIQADELQNMMNQTDPID